jgi:hypothetical protein
MGSFDDWFWADGQQTANFMASGSGIGFMVVAVSDSPLFGVGAGFQGFYSGSVSYGGDPGPSGEFGPDYNDYTNYSGVLGMGYYVPGVAGASLTHVGVYGQTEQPDPSMPQNLLAGVFGAANTGAGVFGWSTTWNGVEGWAYQGTGILGVSDIGYGVQGASTWQPGVLGASGNDAGVKGISDPEALEGPPLPGAPNLAGVIGTSNTQHGVIGTSNALVGVYAYSKNLIGVVGQTSNPASYAGYFAGNLIVTGTKSAAVPFPDGTHRALYCMESPDLWFEDFGEAKLVRGRAVVKVDSDFAKVIKTGDYRVFVTPEGDCGGLYVHRKGAANFEVRELGGGQSSIEFSYRIVGRRKDIKEHRRFAKIDTRLPLPAASRSRRKVVPTAAGLRAFAARLEKRRGSGRLKARRKAEHACAERVRDLISSG